MVAAIVTTVSKWLQSLLNIHNAQMVSIAFSIHVYCSYEILYAVVQRITASLSLNNKLHSYIIFIFYLTEVMHPIN